MENRLDNPVWSALTTRHRLLSAGNDRARHYRPEFGPFAAIADTGAQSFEALADLLRRCDTDEAFALVRRGSYDLPEGFAALDRVSVLQMVKRQAPSVTLRSADIVRLSEVDADDMYALALLTRPGPFRAGTHRIGRFWGVRIDGCLAAMAGERFAMPGFVELSAVCTHPDFRGRGLGAALSVHVAERITEAGDLPFLHVVAENVGAIRLYEKLGFVTRAEMLFTPFRLAGRP